MSETLPPLTVADTVTLECVMQAAQSTAKVARMMPGGDVVYGTARSVGSQNFCFDYTSDVRDLYLRVTSQFGFEYAWKVSDLMTDAANGLFAEYDW